MRSPSRSFSPNPWNQLLNLTALLSMLAVPTLSAAEDILIGGGNSDKLAR